MLLDLLRVYFNLVDEELEFLVFHVDKHVGEEKRVTIDVSSSHVGGPGNIVESGYQESISFLLRNLFSDSLDLFCNSLSSELYI